MRLFLRPLFAACLFCALYCLVWGVITPYIDSGMANFLLLPCLVIAPAILITLALARWAEKHLVAFVFIILISECVCIFCSLLFFLKIR